MQTMRVALVQLEARDDVEANIARAASLAGEAAVGSDLVVLPEYVQFRGSANGYRASARAVPGPTTAPLAAVAREHRCWVLAGSHAEASADPARPFNTAVLCDRSGALVARYRKLHLFDASVDDGPSDLESARVTP
ncbi:MAG: carbon-nitrogen hydrolase family protein, partial [Chloroflexi bacterium]|nr:carbon-nitrogen hydrolase family protein [Chloroflexota bacterium]